MTFVVLLGCFLAAAWASWKRFWYRSGLMQRESRMFKDKVLPMPTLIYWGDIGMNAAIAIGFFLVDPTLEWLGYSEIFRNKVSIIMITATICAIQGLKAAGQNYVRRYNQVEADQEATRDSRLRALGYR